METELKLLLTLLINLAVERSKKKKSSYNKERRLESNFQKLVKK